jgi:hypothetical protein
VKWVSVFVDDLLILVRLTGSLLNLRTYRFLITFLQVIQAVCFNFVDQSAEIARDRLPFFKTLELMLWSATSSKFRLNSSPINQFLL